MPAPTIDTVEERILQDVEATLAAISPLSAVAEFWTGVKKVSRFEGNILAFPASDTPALLISSEGGRTDSFEFHDCVDCSLALQIYCIDKVRDSNWKRDIERFAADVKRALEVDPSRGSLNDQANAFDTRVDNTQVAMNAQDVKVALAMIDLRITFRHLHNDPTIAV